MPLPLSVGVYSGGLRALGARSAVECGRRAWPKRRRGNQDASDDEEDDAQDTERRNRHDA